MDNQENNDGLVPLAGQIQPKRQEGSSTSLFGFNQFSILANSAPLN